MIEQAPSIGIDEPGAPPPVDSSLPTPLPPADSPSPAPLPPAESRTASRRRRNGSGNSKSAAADSAAAGDPSAAGDDASTEPAEGQGDASPEPACPDNPVAAGIPAPEPADATVTASIEVFGVSLGDPIPAVDAQLVLVAPDVPGEHPGREPLPEGPEALESRLRQAGAARVAIVVAGDPLHQGPGRILLAALGPAQVRIHASPGPLQRALARLGLGVGEVEFVPLARLGMLGLIARLRRGCLYAIDPGNLPLREIGQQIEDSGFHQARLWLVEPGPDAPVRALLAFELSDSEHDYPPGTQIVAYTAGATTPRTEFPGIPSAHLDGALPEAARLLALAWLQPGTDEIGWCVEGGAAGLALDWSRQRPAAQLYCIGASPDLVEAAAWQHGAGEGLRAEPASSPGGLASLPDPDLLFIRAGDDLLAHLHTGWERLRPGGRLVAAAEDEQARLELAQFARRNPPERWQDLQIAEGGHASGRISLAPALAVRLMLWRKPARG